MNGTITKKAASSKRGKIANTYRRVVTGNGLRITWAHDRGSPYIELERSLPSDVAAISPFVDKLMVLLRKCGCVRVGVPDVEIALREALANAIIHGNHEEPRKRVQITCRCAPDELSIAVKDEGQGFDFNKIADPTVPENIGSVHGRGIYLMKALTDEVRFEEGGAVVHMRKSTGQTATKNSPKDPGETHPREI